MPVRRRRRATGVVFLIAAIAIVGALIGGSQQRAARPAATPRVGALELRTGRQLVARIPLGPYLRRGRIVGAGLGQAVNRAVPARVTVHRGAARITYAYDRGDAISRAARVAPSGGSIQLARRALSSTIRAPIVRQVQRNDCEATALQVLLATVGIRVDQVRIQSRIPRSGPLDPVGSGPDRVWGDPEQGFVGRPDGGGPAGGFGVYERPLQKVAEAFGAPLHDLTRAPVAALYRRLLSGHALVAWVALSDGPLDRWRSPAGRPVRVNFGEHAIVLAGIRAGGSLRVVNPLEGTAETWSRAKFLSMWSRLGRRALST